MTIEYKRRAAKDLAKQTAKTQQRIKDGLAAVDAGERADLEPITGTRFHRLRVGDWRAILDLTEPRIVRVLKVKPRGGAYK